MTVVEGDTSNKQSDEEPWLVLEREANTPIDDAVKVRIKSESARIEPGEAAEPDGVISS
jgi:hypothetical protein